MPRATFYNLNSEKRERIIDAAMMHIADKGYDRTMISDIIRLAGIPRGSFYQYFEDKYDLFNYIFEHVSKKKLEMFSPVLSKLEDEAFIDLYEEILEYGLKFARDNPIARMIGLQIYRSNEVSLKNILSHLERQGISTIRNYLEADQNNGHIREGIDLDALAMIFYNLNARDILEMLQNGMSDRDILDKAKQVIDIIKHGVVKEEQHGNRIQSE